MDWKQAQKARAAMKFGEPVPKTPHRAQQPGEYRTSRVRDPWRRVLDEEREEAVPAIQKTEMRLPPLTREEVAEHPWSATLCPLPAGASSDLLADVKGALEYCRNVTAENLSRLDPKSDRYQRDRFDQSANMDLILGRLRAVDGALDSIGPVRDESRPALTLDAIRSDPWNAVSLPLPEHPSLDLLDAAADGARDFIAKAMREMPGKEQHEARAYTEESVFEAYERLELLREERQQVQEQPTRMERLMGMARSFVRSPEPEPQPDMDREP